MQSFLLHVHQTNLLYLEMQVISIYFDVFFLATFYIDLYVF